MLSYNLKVLKRKQPFLFNLNVFVLKKTMEFGSMKSRYEEHIPFLKLLVSPELRTNHAKAIINHLSKKQRLCVTELLCNILYGDYVENELHKQILLKHRIKIRQIVLKGKSITNGYIAARAKCAISAIKIAMEIILGYKPQYTAQDVDLVVLQKHLNKTEGHQAFSSEESLQESDDDRDCSDNSDSSSDCGDLCEMNN